MAWGSKSRHERGYGKEWTRIRLVVLARDCGLCQCPHCKTGGKVTIATEVDHIKPKAQGGTDDLRNLRSVSHDCHVRLTAEQQGHKAKRKVKIGLDGWPE